MTSRKLTGDTQIISSSPSVGFGLHAASQGRAIKAYTSDKKKENGQLSMGAVLEEKQRNGT